MSEWAEERTAEMIAGLAPIGVEPGLTRWPVRS